MGDRILLAYNGSERSRDALALAAMLAGDLGARIIVGVVVPAIWADGSRTSYDAELATKADPTLAEARAALCGRRPRISVEGCSVGDTPAATGIADLARSEHATLIVLGSSHRGPLGRIVPGTTLARLIPKAPCPVAIAPAGYADSAPDALRVVGLAFDGGADARRAAKVAVRLAHAACTGLRVFGLAEPTLAPAATMTPIGPSELGAPFDETALREELDPLLETLPEDIGCQRIILRGRAARALVERGPHAVDILVLGSHAYGPLARSVMPSTSLATAKAAPWPVVIVPPPTARSPRPPASADGVPHTRAG